MTEEPATTELIFLLTDVARLLRHELERELAAAHLELTSGEARVLVHVRRRGVLRQNALAEHMGVEPMTVSAFLDRLEERGFVRREPDPADRRAKLVSLTEGGNDVLVEVQPIIDRICQTALADVDEQQCSAMATALKDVRANLAERPRRAVPASGAQPPVEHRRHPQMQAFGPAA